MNYVRLYFDWFGAVVIVSVVLVCLVVAAWLESCRLRRQVRVARRVSARSALRGGAPRPAVPDLSPPNCGLAVECAEGTDFDDWLAAHAEAADPPLNRWH